MTEFPRLEVPPGATCTVYMIDTTVTIDNIPFGRLLEPPVEGLNQTPRLSTYAFMVENSDGRRVLFDLGARKDLKTLAPAVCNMLSTVKWVIKVEKSVLEILEENGYKDTDFEAIIWSHHHWDHIGDVSIFSKNVDLIVGPGFKSAYLPGTNGRGSCEPQIPESDYEGRKMSEVDFSGPDCFKVGSITAYDYFGDGSFYLLDTPGHSVGHLSALVRTSPDNFVVLGADAIHDTGEIRPSQYLPIPETIDLGDFSHPGRSVCCPGHLVHEFQTSRGRKPNEPLFNPTAGYNLHDVRRTIKKLQEIDWNERFFVIYAHDASVGEVVDLFPKPLNSWKENGWDKMAKWKFLTNYLPSLRREARKIQNKDHNQIG